MYERRVRLARVLSLALMWGSVPAWAGGPEPQEGKGLEARCKSACERRNSMRAVGWEMIQMECARSCAEEVAFPRCADRRCAERLADKPLRLEGKLVDKKPTPELVLKDGTHVALTSGPGLWPDDLRAQSGKRAVVIGTLKLEKKSLVLENVTTVAPAD